MSMYNIIKGGPNIIPTLFVLPCLGLHPDKDIPRFRDVFLADDKKPEYKGKIHVYTRVGGNNREGGYGQDKLESHKNFVATYDDSLDSTYGTYVFDIPKKWHTDVECILDGRLKEVSRSYIHQIITVYPKLEGQMRLIFDKL